MRLIRRLLCGVMLLVVWPSCVLPMGGGSDDEGGAPSCAETGVYCSSNVLLDCDDDSVIRDCDSCQWVGPGTGTEYGTTCKAEPSDCTVCDSDAPWSGPGCYFGGGPAVCR